MEVILGRAKGGGQHVPESKPREDGCHGSDTGQS